MNKKIIIPHSNIASKIYSIRGKNVMLSTDLSKLYDVEVRILVQAVKRNIDRFPMDFMFQLNESEYKHLKSQIVISSWGGARRARPYAFTEQGIAMLSSILNSKQAIQVNIKIMRIFIKIRKFILTHKDLKLKIEKLERKHKDHDVKINNIFEAIKQLLDPPKPKKEFKIGFRPD
jgi:hypothetical protein